MKKKFEGNARVKRSYLQALRREFETLEMRTAEKVTEYFSRVITVANKMRNGEEQALKVTFEEKFQRRNSEEQVVKMTSAGGRGHGRGTYRGRGRGRGRTNFNKATVECYRCHQLGHFRYECPSENKEANYAELDEEEEMLLMSYVELYKGKKEDAWFLD